MQRTNRRARRPKTTRRPSAAALADPERALLRYIADHADLLDVVTEIRDEPQRLHQRKGGGYTEVAVASLPMRWVLVQMPPDILDQLAAFEAEDFEDSNDREADDCDVEHTLTEEMEQGTRLRQMEGLGPLHHDDDEDGHDREPDGTDELSVVRPDTMDRSGIVDEAPPIPVYAAHACDGVPITRHQPGTFRRL